MVASDQPAIYVAALHQTTYLSDGTTTYTVKRAKISAVSSGDNTLVALVSSKKIRVICLLLIPDGAVQIYFKNTTTGGICGDSTNPMSLQAGLPFVLAYNPIGWFETGVVSEALILNLSAAVSVGGSLCYIEV